jgi:hypothetical protein
MSTTGIPPSPTGMTITFRYPDRFTEASLAAELSVRLTGKPAAGGIFPTPVTEGRATAVVWVEAGSEVLVYLDSVKVRIAGNVLAVSIDLDSDQTGRTPLIVTLALGGTADPVGMLAVTDDLPRGNGLLAARWGGSVTSAVWGALLALLRDFAAERRLSPVGICISGAALQLVAGDPIAVQ